MARSRSRRGRDASMIAATCDGPFQVVVHHHVVEPVPLRELPSALARRSAILSSSSVPRPRSRRSSSSRDGGTRRIRTASGDALAHLPGTLDVDLEDHVAPGGDAAPRRTPRASRSDAPNDLGPLQQLAVVDHPSNPASSTKRSRRRRPRPAAARGWSRRRKSASRLRGSRDRSRCTTFPCRRRMGRRSRTGCPGARPSRLLLELLEQQLALLRPEAPHAAAWRRCRALP